MTPPSAQLLTESVSGSAQSTRDMIRVSWCSTPNGVSERFGEKAFVEIIILGSAQLLTESVSGSEFTYRFVYPLSAVLNS